MGTLILRWFLSKKVRQASDMCRQVRKLIGAQRDLVSPEEIQEVSKAALELRIRLLRATGLRASRSR